VLERRQAFPLLRVEKLGGPVTPEQTGPRRHSAHPLAQGRSVCITERDRRVCAARAICGVRNASSEFEIDETRTVESAPHYLPACRLASPDLSNPQRLEFAITVEGMIRVELTVVWAISSLHLSQWEPTRRRGS
jgi:hypothetical protein